MPMPMLQLPPDLQRAIEARLASMPQSRWLAAAQTLSERYRARRNGGEAPLAHGEMDVLGYLALLLPATYAQIGGALAMVAARTGDWSPATMLDLGSGPGTALWAAAATFAGPLSCEAWEREPAFIAVGRELARSNPALAATRWRSFDLGDQDTSETAPRDLVTIAHVLNELPPAAREAVVQRAWRATAGVLLIVEPGTPEGFALVRAARDLLLAHGAQTIAPCPHNLPCPLAGDWCHFPQRIARPPFQRIARAAPSPWEESKFAFAALARFPQPLPFAGRVIREPFANKAYAEAIICRSDAVAPLRAPKRDLATYRAIAARTWGEALEDRAATDVKG